jgi:hypothetical protein
MRKLNCKEVNEALKKEIIDSYESTKEYFTFDGAEMKTEYNDICKDILEAFKREKLDNDLRYEAGWLVWSLSDGGCGVVYRRKDGKMIITTGLQGDFCYC